MQHQFLAVRDKQLTKAARLVKYLEINQIDWLYPINAPSITHLTLHRFICSAQHLYMMTKSRILIQLKKLDISHSSGMTGTLSILLCHSFPSLNALILSDCGLSSEDLSSLAQAKVKSRLPQLRHLDISNNSGLEVGWQSLFSHTCKWGDLRSLNVESSSNSWFSHLSSKVKYGCLQNKENLQLSVDHTFLERIDNTWRSLKILQIS